MGDHLYTDRPIVVFDLETTGKDAERARIIQFAGIKIDCDLVEVGRFFRTIDPDWPIEEEASKIHGVRAEDVRGAPRFKDVVADINLFLHECDLAGHNAISFDVAILSHEYERVGLELDLSKRRLIDTLELFRHFLPHTLECALRHYCNEKLEGAHDALCDADATVKVLKAQLVAHSINTDVAGKLSVGSRVTLDGKLAHNEDGEVIITFGKYKGSTLGWLAKHDPGFLRWIKKKDFSAEVKACVNRALLGEL